MPFTKQTDREKVDQIVKIMTDLKGLQATLTPGDLCFNHYRDMKKAWKSQRRWTTADAIAKKLYPDDDTRAYFLAFLVLFIKEVMKYEEEKLAENGDVE